MLKNKSILGLPNFIKEFHKDCLSGITTGWWNERGGRRTERFSITHNDKLLANTYQIIEAIRDEPETFTDEDIEDICNSVVRTHRYLRLKRVYLWGVDFEQEQEEEVLLEEDDPTEEEEKEESNEEEEVEIQEEKPSPDFEFAKGIKDKQELKAYAKDFGFKLDSRKSLSDMMKSFQGKYHASKNK